MHSNYSYFILLCCFIVLSSCGEETLKFTEPQPRTKKNLTEVKNNFIGSYMDFSNGSMLIIDKNEIRSEEYLDTIRFAKPEFDSLGKYEVKDGDLYELGRKLKYPLSWENDTAIITHAYTESYFDFSEFQVLRQDNNRLFLNYSDNDGLWRVEILSLKDDILTWYMIPVNEGSLKNMSQIIETIEEVEKQNMLTADGEIIGYNDTTIIAKDVKKRDFKTMIKNDMLKEISRFKRVDH